MKKVQRNSINKKQNGLKQSKDEKLSTIPSTENGGGGEGGGGGGEQVVVAMVGSCGYTDRST